MGMAASQARFLGITARKTNTEYEGQQVNQQRTALANQSANLFNQMLALQVPTPPNKNDSAYTKTVYSFIDDMGVPATIESIVTNPDPATSGTYPKVVKYTTSEEVAKAYRNTLASAVISPKEKEDKSAWVPYITVGSNAPAEVSRLEYEPTTYKEDETYDADAAAAKEAISTNYPSADVSGLYKFTASNGVSYYINKPVTGNKPSDIYTQDGVRVAEAAAPTYYNSAIQGTQETGLTIAGKALTPCDTVDDSGYPYKPSDVDKAYLKTIRDTYAQVQNENVFYKYSINGVDYYIPESMTTGTFGEQDFALNKNDLKQNPPYGFYVQDTSQNLEKEFPANVTYDASGRLQSLIIKDGENVLNYTVSVNSITDEDKYEDAMQQYKYDMAKYDKEIEDINAKTQAIQVQDRTLELRLKQLDTEQEALTQEMDAIKKVIDKNVETTFKTFA